MRRKRGDMIQIYKIFNGIDEVEIGLGTLRNEGPYSKRSHNFQIQRDISKNCPMRDGFLPNRSATTWNLLPSNIVNAQSVNSFKARFDDHMNSCGLRRSIYRT